MQITRTREIIIPIVQYKRGERNLGMECLQSIKVTPTELVSERYIELALLVEGLFFVVIAAEQGCVPSVMVKEV